MKHISTFYLLLMCHLSIFGQVDQYLIKSDTFQVELNYEQDLPGQDSLDATWDSTKYWHNTSDYGFSEVINLPEGFVFFFNGRKVDQFIITPNGVLIFDTQNINSFSYEELKNIDAIPSSSFPSESVKCFGIQPRGSVLVLQKVFSDPDSIKPKQLWIKWIHNGPRGRGIPRVFSLVLEEKTYEMYQVFQMNPRNTVVYGNLGVQIDENYGLSTEYLFEGEIERSRDNNVIYRIIPQSDLAIHKLEFLFDGDCTSFIRNLEVTLKNVGNTNISSISTNHTIDPSLSSITGQELIETFLLPGETTIQYIPVTLEGVYEFNLQYQVAQDFNLSNNSSSFFVRSKLPELVSNISDVDNFEGCSNGSLAEVCSDNLVHSLNDVNILRQGSWGTAFFRNILGGVNGMAAKINPKYKGANWLVGRPITINEPSSIFYYLSTTAVNESDFRAIEQGDSIAFVLVDYCNSQIETLRTYTAEDLLSDGFQDTVLLCEYEGSTVYPSFVVYHNNDSVANYDVFVDNIAFQTSEVRDVEATIVDLDCTTEPEGMIIIDTIYANFTDYTIEWRQENNSTIIGTGPAIFDLPPGTYILNIKNQFGCQVYSRSFVIKAFSGYIKPQPDWDTNISNHTIEIINNTSDSQSFDWQWIFIHKITPDSSGRSDIINEVSPKYRYQQAGMYEIELLLETACEIIRDFDTIWAPLHIDIYPNRVPSGSREIINIRIELENNQSIELLLVDISGKEVFREEFEGFNAAFSKSVYKVFNFQLPANLSRGHYLVKVWLKNQRKWLRFEKKQVIIVE